MKGLRLLNNGDWNKPPVLTAARRILINGLGSHYDKTSLGEAAIFLNGTSYDVAQINEFGSAPIIRISNITDPSSAYLRTNERFDQKFWVAAGDLLVSWSASFKSIIWPGPEGLLNQHIFKVTERAGFDRRFIRHAIEASFDEMQQNVVGIGMMHLRRADFLGHLIPAPPLEVQQVVANFLDFMETERQGKQPELPIILSEQRRVVASIEELAAKITEARSLRLQAAAEADILSYAEMKAARERLMNAGTQLARLGDVTKVTSGGTPSRGISTYWGGDIPWVKTGELLDGDIQHTEEHITVEGVKNSSAKIFPEETVLVALYGQGQTRGRTGRLLIPAATNQACCAVLPNPTRFESRFLQYWLRSLYFELREDSHGGAQPNWNGSMIKDLEIAFPSISQQRRFVVELDALQAEVDALKHLQMETSQELDALLPAIFDRALNGRI